MLPKTILYCGTRETPPQPLELRAGPLTMLFEPATGFLRYLRLGEHEVLRAIYGAVRDQNWGTVLPIISKLRTDIQPDSFQLSFEAICRQAEINFVWQGLISGDATGRVSFTFDGQAHSRFLRNRIGLCVLHPISACSGRPCRVRHSDGTEERGNFPKSISPHQPFLNIASLSYGVPATGITAQIQFAGEIFEMEDQRNWTDYSFKTYSTPQQLPKPVIVEPQSKVQQSVTLILTGKVPSVPPARQAGPPEIVIATKQGLRLPPIGYGIAGQAQPLSEREIQRLQRLRPSHLRVDLRLSSPQYPALLQQATDQARQLDTGLHIALLLSGEAQKELRAFTEELNRIQPKVLLWLIFHEAEEATQEKWVRLAQASLQSYAPNGPMAAGSREFFTELNRNRPPANAGYFPCYPANPQVHNRDNRTMVENLAGAASTVETAKEFASHPVLISRITLRTPAGPALPGAGQTLPSDVDPRQMSLFGAGWTLGSIARLAATGNVHSLTYFETIGWRGLMETEAGSPLPEEFPSIPGSVFPVYHLLADLAEFAGKQIYPIQTSHPLLVDGLTLFDSAGRRRILVANFTDQEQQISVRSGKCKARIGCLDQTNVEEAMREPETFRLKPATTAISVSEQIELRLLPFALARIDIE